MVRPPTLQTLAREETCKLTLNAINNILLQEDNEVYHRKLCSDGKRKRTYSCGDETQVKLTARKKTKAACDQHVQIITTKGKRVREQEHDDVDTVHRKRRKGNVESSQGSDSLATSSLPNHQPASGSKDDVTVHYRMSASEKMESLRHYYTDLTPSMWTAYGTSLVDKVIRKIRFESMDNKTLGKTIEHIFCAKLLSFSTVAIERYVSNLEKIIFDKLAKCTRLEKLEMTVVPSGERDVVAATLALQRLGHLHSLSLLPSSRFSYHWVISQLACHCHALRELKIVYNGDLFDSTNEVAGLHRCTRLTSLWLFNFGRNSEIREVSQLMELLQNLKVLFHKELPNAILELKGSWRTGEQVRPPKVGLQLGLERVDLCWHQRAIGYQLVYVPSSHLMQVAKVCPQLKVLNLVGPPYLAQVLENLPHLHVLILQQASLTSCLACALNNLGLSRITELRVTDVWDVTHDIISAIACGCPHLQVLNIINSSLEARGDLQTLTHRPPFPNLRQVTLVPVMIHSRPPLTTPSVWQLGAQLTSYLLSGASQLTDIYLHYKPEDILDGDLPAAQLFQDILSCPRLGLCSVRLEWPPAVSPGLVRAMVRACPALATVASIITWPLTSHQRAAIVTQHGRCIDIT